MALLVLVSFLSCGLSASPLLAWLGPTPSWGLVCLLAEMEQPCPPDLVWLTDNGSSRWTLSGWGLTERHVLPVWIPAHDIPVCSGAGFGPAGSPEPHLQNNSGIVTVWWQGQGLMALQRALCFCPRWRHC